MKKLFKSRLFLTALVIFGIVIVLSKTSFAQDAVEKVSILESQMTQLIDSQSKLTETLSGLLVREESQPAELPMTTIMSGEDKLGCSAKLDAMSSSSTYNPPTGWNVDFASTIYPPNGELNWVREYLMDLNGDGLTDYFYIYTRNYNGSIYNKNCVYINNGVTLEEEYICSGSYTGGTWSYKGDCADYS